MTTPPRKPARPSRTPGNLAATGGQVEVLWNKGGQEGVEIQKDSGTGLWSFLALDTRPERPAPLNNKSKNLLATARRPLQPVKVSEMRKLTTPLDILE